MAALAMCTQKTTIDSEELVGLIGRGTIAGPVWVVSCPGPCVRLTVCPLGAAIALATAGLLPIFRCGKLLSSVFHKLVRVHTGRPDR